jgi:hypothetical protein
MKDRREEVFVRKVIAVELVSLDGLMGSPEEQAFPYSIEEMEEGPHPRAARDRGLEKYAGRR